LKALVRPGNFEQVLFTTVDPDDQARLPGLLPDRGGWIAGNHGPVAWTRR
jgi:hypothetical protein